MCQQHHWFSFKPVPFWGRESEAKARRLDKYVIKRTEFKFAKHREGVGQRDSTALPRPCLLPPCFPAPMEAQSPTLGGLSQKNAKCSVCPGLKNLTVHLRESRSWLLLFIIIIFVKGEAQEKKKTKPYKPREERLTFHVATEGRFPQGNEHQCWWAHPAASPGQPRPLPAFPLPRLLLSCAGFFFPSYLHLPHYCFESLK